MKIYPLKLKPELKDIICGGTRAAEAWTLTLRFDGENIIENGDFCGKTLSEYAKSIGMEALCGKKYKKSDIYEFPLLIKLIHAKEKLSVHVHPDNEYAHSHGIDSGKTEMWYVVDAMTGAQIVYGLKDGTDISSKEFQFAIGAGNISEYLNYVNVKKGDVFYIPAGLVHAIGEGILIAQVQQNSNATFRIYDYGRVGKDGKPRELHLERAKEVIKNDFSHDHSIGSLLLPDTVGMPVKLVDSEFFEVTLLNLENGIKQSFGGGKMQSILCVEGEAFILYKNDKGNTERIPMGAADSVLVPAAFSGYEICLAKKARLLIAEADK